MNLSAKPFYLNDEQIKWVNETLKGLTVKQKIGQLFCLNGTGYSKTELESLVRDYCIGGVLLRPDTMAAIKENFENLNKIAPVPLFKGANLEEGGNGIASDGTYFGSQMEVAAADDDEVTERFSKVCAAEGVASGVNWTFSPVVDIDYNFRNPITNVRTFGSDPEKVLKNASIYVKELQKAGIAACCKHFPGDGVDFRDQHLHPTYNDLPAHKWFSTYGHIYKTLIDEGIMSVMVGHIVQPNVIKYINPDASDDMLLPASQSREMLTGVLREKFEFNGVIITDATIMGGYTLSMARSKAIPTTIAAGCDMFCFTTDIYEDMGYMLAGLESGIVTEERLDEAVTRILALKAKVAASGKAPEADSKAWAKECADKAVTLVKDTQKLVPATPEKYPDIRLIVIGEDKIHDGSITELAKNYLEDNGFNVQVFEPEKENLRGPSGIPENRLTVMLANLPTKSNNVTVRINWHRKHAINGPKYVNEEKIAFISLYNPYHLQDVPRVRTYINAYFPTKDTIESSLAALIGKAEFNGKSPVDAFCGLYDARV